jgi:hypothetical protein
VAKQDYKSRKTLDIVGSNSFESTLDYPQSHTLSQIWETANPLGIYDGPFITLVC